MPYRMITNLGKICGRLAGAATEHAERIVSSLTERWRDRLEEGEELTVTKMLIFLAEDLRQIHDQSIATESQLRSEIREDKQARNVRDRSTSALRELLFDVKKVCDAHYGPGSVETLFEEDSENVSSEASEVLRLASRVRHNMSDPEFPLPPLKHGIAPDLAALAARFDQPLALLAASLRQLQHGTQASSGVIADKEREQIEIEGFAGRAGRMLEGMTSFAGHEGVARRIRLSRHRTRADVEESEEEVAEDAATEDEAPDAGGVETGGTPA